MSVSVRWSQNLARLVQAVSYVARMSIAVTVVLFPTMCSSPAYSQTIEADEPPLLTKAVRAEIIDSVTTALDSFYVFPDVAEKMGKHVRKQLKKGAYKDLTDRQEFATRLTEDLRSICKDRHLGVGAAPPEEIRRRLAPPDSVTDEMCQQMLEEQQIENFGFVKAERMDGNIGYLRFDGFSGTRHAGRTATAALNFLGYCDALIIDLRQNGGGSPEMIQLISSYFFDEPVHLNSFYLRPEDTIKQFWTAAWVEGPRMEDVDLYILTSRFTFSAAEEFTYNLKNMERATIVGETTGGGAHPVMGVGFANLGIGMRVPMGRAINPVTGTNWEGTGIEPHVACPADSALDVAKYEALRALVARIEDEDRRFGLNWSVETIEALRNPVTIDPAVLQSHVGRYGPRTILLEDGVPYYQREDRPRYRMIPMSEDTFMFEDLEYFRLRFVRDESDPDKIVAVEGVYRQGHIDRSERTPDGS